MTDRDDPLVRECLRFADLTEVRANMGDLIARVADRIAADAATIKGLKSEPLQLTLSQNKCGDADCEEARLDAALRCLRGGPTHRATADMVNASEDAWRDAAGTEAVMRTQAERELSEARAQIEALERQNTLLFDSHDEEYRR